MQDTELIVNEELNISDDAKDSIRRDRSVNLIKSIVFVGLFIVMLTSLTYMLRTNGDVKDRFTGFYAEPKNSLDVIMIGSSPTYSSCSSPMLYGEYGIKAYPLASNVQRPSAGVYLVKEAEKTQSPKLYMFEMRMYASVEEGLHANMAYSRGATDNLKYSLNRIALINELVPEANERYTYYFDIFKYHSNWKTLRLWDQIMCYRYVKPDPDKGTVLTDKVGPAIQPVIDSSVVPIKIDAPQEEALYELIKYIKDNNLNALFYLSPYQMNEEEMGKFAYIEQIVESEGFTFLDMNDYYDEIGIDFETDFSDYGVHTNAAGEAKCTKFIGDYLKANYDIADHREESSKENASWEDSYDKWSAEYESDIQTIAERVANEDWAVLSEE